MLKIKNKKVPPDGGWGWIIMLAYILTNFLAIPLHHNFGLIFKDTFEKMDLLGRHETLVISVNSASALLCRPLVRTLFQQYGISIRKMAVFGSLIYAVGIIGSAFANNYVEIVALYGVTTGVGLGIIQLSFQLALDSYFCIQKSVVNRLSLAFRTLGSALLPLVYVTLLRNYGIKNTMLVVGGISIQITWLSMLLQPVEWHLKESERDRQVLQKACDVGLNKIDILGMTCCAFADICFSALLPFILFDLKFDHYQIGIFLLAMNVVNSFAKFFVLIIGDFTNISTKTKFLCSCITVIATRLSIVYFVEPNAFVAAALLLGIAKASSTVHWLALLTNNVPFEQLVITENRLMITTGFLTFIAGSLLGCLKDVTGSYVHSIHIFNVVTSASCLIWIVEFIYVRHKKNNRCNIYLTT